MSFILVLLDGKPLGRVHLFQSTYYTLSTVDIINSDDGAINKNGDCPGSPGELNS